MLPYKLGRIDHCCKYFVLAALSYDGIGDFDKLMQVDVTESHRVYIMYSQSLELAFIYRKSHQWKMHPFKSWQDPYSFSYRNCALAAAIKTKMSVL